MRLYSRFEVINASPVAVLHGLDLLALHQLSFWDALILQAALIYAPRIQSQRCWPPAIGQESTVATDSFLPNHIDKRVSKRHGAALASMTAKRSIYRAVALGAARLLINSSICLMRALSRMTCASGKASVRSGDVVAKSPCLAATRATASIEPASEPCT